MTPQNLLRLGAGAAVLGGGLRVAAAFIPYTPESPALEALYAVIDIALLFGLVAIYANEADSLGWPGLAAFAVSFAGLASIVGPDSNAFGVDWYIVGATASALGMAAFGAVLLSARRLRLAAAFWLAVPTVALFAPAPVAFLPAGLLFGMGFVMAGLTLITQPAAGTG